MDRRIDRAVDDLIRAVVGARYVRRRALGQWRATYTPATAHLPRNKVSLRDSIVGMPGSKSRCSYLGVVVSMLLCCVPAFNAVPVAAIIVQPRASEIDIALQRGRAAADNRTPPDRLYAWFGSDEDLEPRGFLMTKIVGLTVMSTHFALRSETPGEADIRQVLEEDTLLVSTIIFGDTPQFAVDSYMVLTQGARSIKPVRVRFDGQAARTSVWPNGPAYRAKVVASFRYADLDATALSVVSVFPGQGGEVQFQVDFSKID